MGGHVTVTSWNTKEEAIVIGELVRLDDGVTGFGGRLHEFEDIIREGLWDS